MLEKKRFTYGQMKLIPNAGENEIHICANDIDSKCWGKGDSHMCK
jgi:hypothetical protein